MPWKKKLGSGSTIESWASLGEGTTVEGKFVGIRSIEGKYGDSFICEILTEHDGQRTFGCPAILYDRLQGVPADTPVKIEYLGKKPGGQGTVHLFNVSVWEGDGSDDLPF